MKNAPIEPGQRLAEQIAALDAARANAEQRGWEPVIRYCKAETSRLLRKWHDLGVDIGSDPELYVPSAARQAAGQKRGLALAGKPRRGTKMKPW